jgi:hypothetical protein
MLTSHNLNAAFRNESSPGRLPSLPLPKPKLTTSLRSSLSNSPSEQPKQVSPDCGLNVLCGCDVTQSQMRELSLLNLGNNAALVPPKQTLQFDGVQTHLCPVNHLALGCNLAVNPRMGPVPYKPASPCGLDDRNDPTTGKCGSTLIKNKNERKFNHSEASEGSPYLLRAFL